MRTPLLLAALALAAAALPFLGSAAPSPTSPRALGPGAVYSLHVELFRALDACDGDALSKLLSRSPRGFTVVGDAWNERGAGLQMFLRAPDGSPIEAETPEDARKLMIGQDALDGSSKGWTTRILDGWTDCASPAVSYATLHFERTRVVDGKPVVRRYRSTSLVSYEDGAWRLWHFHVSPAGA